MFLGLGIWCKCLMILSDCLGDDLSIERRTSKPPRGPRAPAQKLVRHPSPTVHPSITSTFEPMYHPRSSFSCADTHGLTGRVHRRKAAVHALRPKGEKYRPTLRASPLQNRITTRIRTRSHLVTLDFASQSFGLLSTGIDSSVSTDFHPPIIIAPQVVPTPSICAFGSLACPSARHPNFSSFGPRDGEIIPVLLLLAGAYITLGSIP